MCGIEQHFHRDFDGYDKSGGYNNTTSEPSEHNKLRFIAKWYHEQTNPGHSSEIDDFLIDIFNDIGFLWPVAKRIVAECQKILKDERVSIEKRREMAIPAGKVMAAAGTLDESKFIEAMYYAVVDITQYNIYYKNLKTFN